MAISVSVVILFLIILIMMLRSGSIKPGGALVATLFGFFLASSGLAPAINRFVESLAQSINQISF